MHSVVLFSLMALLSKKKKTKQLGSCMSVSLSSYDILLPNKIHKNLYYLVWNSHHQTHSFESHTGKALSLESFRWVHVPREDPGTSWNFSVSKWSQLDLSDKLIFILGEEKSLTQRLWDLGHICFIVQDQVPRKPKTAGVQCQGLIHRWGVGLTPGGWGDQGYSGGASPIMNFTCFTISPWTYLLILNSVFFPLGLVQFPLAQRLQSSMYYSFAALLWPRRIKLIEDRFSLSTRPWDSGSEWMLTCLFVISLAQPSFLTDQHPGDLTDETIFLRLRS